MIDEKRAEKGLLSKSQAFNFQGIIILWCNFGVPGFQECALSTTSKHRPRSWTKYDDREAVLREPKWVIVLLTLCRHTEF
jgi:hypothetical protein